MSPVEAKHRTCVRKRKKKKHTLKRHKVSPLQISGTSDLMIFFVSSRIQVEFYFQLCLFAVREIYIGKGYQPDINAYCAATVLGRARSEK